MNATSLRAPIAALLLVPLLSAAPAQTATTPTATPTTPPGGTCLDKGK